MGPRYFWFRDQMTFGFQFIHFYKMNWIIYLIHNMQSTLYDKSCLNRSIDTNKSEFHLLPKTQFIDFTLYHNFTSELVLTYNKTLYSFISLSNTSEHHMHECSKYEKSFTHCFVRSILFVQWILDITRLLVCDNIICVTFQT